MILSVIIPVYNVEHTLDRCVESVLRQDVPEMEVILIDDGSPDRCLELCDEWARRDSRIRVVHKVNGGLSDARNAGIDIATGDYITFVDSDDYILSDTYPPLISFLQEHGDIDMLEYAIQQEDLSRHKLSLGDDIFHSPNEYWLSTMAWNHAYAVNKIYQRRLFKGCRYEKGRTFEDLLILPQLLKSCSKIATTATGTYVYTANINGISKQVTLQSVISLLRAQVNALWVMKTMPWSKNGTNLWYYICCRCYDIIRLTISRCAK